MREKKNCKIFFTLIFSFILCNAFAQRSFQKQYYFIQSYGGGGTVGANVLQTSDTGFIMIGIATDTVNAGAYLIKTDKYGDTLWTKTYGILSSIAGYAIIQTSDGGFAFCGQAVDGIFFIKTNNSGDTLWAKKYLCGEYSVATSLTETSDGNYIVTGYTRNGNFDDIFLMKTDLNGQLLWFKMLGETFLDRALFVCEVKDGSGFVIGGLTQNFSFANTKYYVIKTDVNGNIVWSKYYFEYSINNLRCMQKTNDGGFILVGSTNAPAPANDDVFLLKIDSVGNIMWNKNFDNGNYDTGYYVDQTSDNGFIITGMSVDYHLYLIKTNEHGDSLWTKTIKSSGQGYCVHQTFDGGYILLDYGYRLTKTDNIGNACMQNSTVTRIKNYVVVSKSVITPSTSPSINVSSLNLTLRSIGRVTKLCNILNVSEIENQSSLPIIFPNPALHKFSINEEWANGHYPLRIIIYDVTSRNVKEEKNTNQISIENIPEGVYFVKITDNKRETFVSKLVVQK